MDGSTRNNNKKIKKTKMEKKHYIWGLAIIALVLIIIFRKNIAELFAGKPVNMTKRSTNPSVQKFRDRASEISARLTTLIDDTNRKLKEVDGGVIAPSSNKPKGLENCACWSILWGAYAFYSWKCCKPASARGVENAKADAIIADFKSKVTAIENEVSRLQSETDQAFPQSTIAKDEVGCPCWCITYAGITILCKNRPKCCKTAAL